MALLHKWLSLFITCYAFSRVGASDVGTESFDVLVFGATGAGCVAAIAASRAGAAHVLLLSTNTHVGGMLTGGLQHTDSANASVIGGITREIFIRCEQMYPGRPTNASYPPGHSPPGWLFESHMMRAVVDEMLQEANVSVVLAAGAIAAVSRRVAAGRTLQTLHTESAASYTASVFIDASYEGDLAAAANCTMALGREAVAQYSELRAGRLKGVPIDTSASVSPYWNASLFPYDVRSNIIPHVASATPVAVGAADSWIEPFDFRLCFTNSPGNKESFTQPASYDPREFEMWRRIYQQHPPATLAQAGLSCLGPIPNNYSDCEGACRKCDMLGMNHGTDDTDASWSYITANSTGRAAISRQHTLFTQGLLWFWLTDASVPATVKAELAGWGHCSDEYSAESDPPHWPPQLYIREGRRLVGDWVWTEYALDQQKRDRSVGLGSYSFDSHFVSRIVHRTGKASNDFVVKEGRVHVQQEQGGTGVKHGSSTAARPCNVCMAAPFRMPYDAMLPQKTQVTNLLVPVAISASHVRFNAIRMEPTWMILGESAGVSAAMACVGHGGDVHAVDIHHLQAALHAQGQKIDP